jgi:hypothetical protein
MGAAMIAPELELSREESKDLAAALADVNQYYNHVVDPKILAWVGLISVCGKVYGPRVGAVILRKKMEAEKTRRAPLAGQNVTEIRPRQTAPVSQPIRETFSDPSFVSVPGADA